MDTKKRKPVEPSSENDGVHNDSSESDWEPMSSDSEDEYTEEDMESLKNKKKATTKKVTAKGKKKKVSKNEEKVQAALVKLMPNMYKKHAKLMSRRILKAKPINYELLQVLRDILKDKHRERKVTGNPSNRGLDPDQEQILHLLKECAKGYNLTHVAHDLVMEYQHRANYLKEKQRRLERRAMAAAGGGKKGE